MDRREKRVLTLAAVLAATLGSLPARAMDVARPARVRITVTDAKGQAFQGAKVRAVREMPGWPVLTPAVASLTTDAQGQVSLQQKRLPEDPEIAWRVNVRVERKGHVPKEFPLDLFPGAEIAETVALDPIRTTLIRLRGPRDQPLPDVGFSIYYSDGQHSRSVYGDPKFICTDRQGEYRWEHGPVNGRFRLWISGEKTYEAAPVVTVTFGRDGLPVAGRLLRGKLLDADGKPAAGWFVARKVRHTGSMGLIGGPAWSRMEVEDLAKVPADGAFEVVAETHLLVVSPQGLPFLYRVDPRNWEPGARRVTLRLPPVRCVHRGQVVYEDGTPVEGLPINVDFARAADGNWRVIVGPAVDGTVIRTIRTDAEGRYALPIYYGSRTTYRICRSGWRPVWNDRLCGQIRRNVWKRDKTEDPAQLKDVTIVLEDRQGRPVEGMSLWRSKQYAAGKEVPQGGWPRGRDARGLHLFVDRSVDRIDLEARDADARWTTVKTSLHLDGTGDQVLHVKLDADRRMKPLAGSVTDPDGKPVAGADVCLFRPPSPDRPKTDRDYLGLYDKTDAQGRFAFAAAPDACSIEVSRRSRDPGGNLPGWIDPVPVDRDTREVSIRLNRGGSLRVLLPPGVEGAAVSVRAKREDGVYDAVRSYCWPRYEKAGHYLDSGIIRPGTYRLQTYELKTLETLGDLNEVRVEVKPGEQAVVDLRGRKVAAPKTPPPARPEAWTTVVVQQQGRALSGAEVVVLVDAERPENVARWIKEWTGGDATRRKSAVAKLKQAGAQAIDAVRAWDRPSQVEGLLQEVTTRDGNGLVPDGLQRLTADLSDDAGQVRCRIEVGRHGVAVARVCGRWIGFREFTAGGGPVTVSMRPARTLVVDAKPSEDPSRRFLETWIRFDRPFGPVTRALMRVLFRTGEDSWLSDTTLRYHRWWIREEAQWTWVLEDLPVGEVCEVELRQDEVGGPLKARRMKIESGPGVQRLAF